jgi:tripartite-type tricarboxylate transporter receptor subunit TctC
MRRERSMQVHRRRFLLLSAGAAALPVVAAAAPADAYPSRPVRLIVGLPPGSAPDIMARLAAQWLEQRLKQSFLVDNRPGSASNIATEAVARSEPDGYTLLLVTAGNAINATLYRHVNVNFSTDIAPVAALGRTPFVMVVNPSVPAKTIPELIAYAKANPGKLNLASPGLGATNELFGALFEMMTGTRFLHVPYRVSLFPDLLSGEMQVYFGAIPGVISYVNTGQLRALAVTTTSRVDVLPDVPSMSEFVPGYEANGWLGLGAPAKTPPEIIDILNNQIRVFEADPGTRRQLADIGVIPMSATPAEFTKFIADQTNKWAEVVTFAGLKAD